MLRRAVRKQKIYSGYYRSSQWLKGAEQDQWLKGAEKANPTGLSASTRLFKGVVAPASSIGTQKPDQYRTDGGRESYR